MEIFIHENQNIRIAEIISHNIIIKETQDILDLMGESDYMGARSIIFHENHFPAEFFDLKTGFAGEILQKFSTYDFRLAIIGDFSKFNSKSLQDFIRESNRGNRIFFVNNHQTAMIKLTGKTK
jgi:hypothetical protein